MPQQINDLIQNMNAPELSWRIERRLIEGHRVALVVRGYGSNARYVTGGDSAPTGWPKRFKLAEARAFIAKATESAA